MSEETTEQHSNTENKDDLDDVNDNQTCESGETSPEAETTTASNPSEPQPNQTEKNDDDSSKPIASKTNRNESNLSESRPTHVKKNQNDSSKHSNNSKAEKTEQSKAEKTPKGKEKDDNQKKRAKSAGKKYGFRLSPEEQELAYELKASMMRKMENQNAGLQSELDTRKSMVSLQRQQQQTLYMSRTVLGNGLSQHNLKLLMKAYEKKAKDAEERINQLEQELDDANDLAKRYHDMYVNERSKSGSGSGSGTNRGGGPGTQTKEDKKLQEKENETTEKKTDEKPTTDNNDKSQDNRQSGGNAGKNKSASPQKHNTADQNAKSPRGSKDKTTEGDLEDDEAVYKRHVVKIVDKKAMSGTSPIRVQDVIWKNEVLITDNEKLKREVERLKWDNKQLLIQVKHSWAHKDKLMHEISTSESARKELTKRLEREQKQKQTLGRSLSRQAADWIQFKRDLHESEEKQRLSMIGPISSSQSAAEERTYIHAAKRNVHMPRNIPVKHWAQANKT